MEYIERKMLLKTMLDEMVAAGQTIDEAESDLEDELDETAQEWRDEHEEAA